MKILFHTETGSTRPYPRGDDLPVVGLSPEYQVFDLHIQDAPAYNPAVESIELLSGVVNTAAKTITRAWRVVPHPIRPAIVTMRSFRLALGLELFNQLSAAINALTDAEQKYQALTYIEYSLTVVQDHPMVVQLSAALNKTNEEVAAVFKAARYLDYLAEGHAPQAPPSSTADPLSALMSATAANSGI